MLLKFLKDETGATAIEYGLIVSVLSLAVIGGFALFADSLEFMFSDTDSKLVGAFN